MLWCRPQAEVNWPEAVHEKSLVPRVPPLRHVLSKAPSTRIGTFWIRSRERKILTDAKSGYFFIRWRNNIERSSLPWILYSRWQPRCQVLSRQSKMQILRACFYNACSVANFPSGVLGTRVKPDTCRIRVDGQIRFDHGYVWTWKLLNPERKSCGYKNIRMHVDGAENS